MSRSTISVDDCTIVVDVVEDEHVLVPFTTSGAAHPPSGVVLQTFSPQLCSVFSTRYVLRG